MARPTLRQHRKFRRLLLILGIPEAHALGHLEMLWSSCYESGDPYLGDATDVELAAGWVGEPGVLAAALAACGAPKEGFIEPVEPGIFQVHDLLDHAPSYVQGRKQREEERRAEKSCAWCGVGFKSGDSRSEYCSPACRTAAWRHRKTDKSSGVTDGDGRERSRNVTVTERDATPAPAPAPAPQIEEAIASSCPEPQAAPGPETPAIYFVPCLGTGPKTWALTQEKLDEWTAAFPGVDVKAELRKAIQWLRDNPSRGKTARGMPAFFGRWLGNAQDSATLKPSTRPNGATHGQTRTHHRTAVDERYLEINGTRTGADQSQLPDVRPGDPSGCSHPPLDW